MNPRQIVAENTSQSEGWRTGSFIDVLHESYRWDTDEYWKLEWSLYALASTDGADTPDADIFRIFSYVMWLFGCHFDPNDGFEFANLTADELYSFRERFQLVFEGYFSRSMPSLANFESGNPLFVE